MASRLLGIFRRSDREPDCEDVQGTSSDFIDDDLDENAKRRLIAHLEWCGPCTTFLNTLRATVEMLRSTPKEAPPADFKNRLRDSIGKERAG